MKTKSNDAVLYFRGVPRDVKDKFKAYCAARGETMHEKIISLMRQCIAEDAKRSTK